MSDMSPDAKALLDAARDGDDPGAQDDARTRRALVAKLGVGLAVAASTTASTSAAAGAAGAGSAMVGGALAASSAGMLVAKVFVAVALIGGIGAGGAAIYTSSASPVPDAPHVSAPVQPVPATRPIASITFAQAAAESPFANFHAADPADAVPSAAIPAPVRTAPTPAVRANPAAPPTPARSAANPRAGTLDEETRLVRGADAALRAGDPALALALLDDHARSFPNGVLAEERAAERVLALCAGGRAADARAAADAFLRERPGSALAPRVRSACKAP